MSDRWAVRLPRDAVASLGPLRRRSAIKVLELPDCIWLRGDSADDSLSLALKQLPGAQRFTTLDDDQMIPAGAQVPRGYLPLGEWQPLACWLTPTFPLAALPGRVAEKLKVTLVRSTVERDANVLRTTLAEWRDHATMAAEVRLLRWTFAVSEKCDVLVRGLPLPSLPGQRFVECEGIAVPAGWTWSPPVDAAVLARVFEIVPSDLVLLHPDGGNEHIAATSFVRASRSAVRLSAEETAHG